MMWNFEYAFFRIILNVLTDKFKDNISPIKEYTLIDIRTEDYRDKLFEVIRDIDFSEHIIKDDYPRHLAVQAAKIRAEYLIHILADKTGFLIIHPASVMLFPTFNWIRF